MACVHCGELIYKDRPSRLKIFTESYAILTANIIVCLKTPLNEFKKDFNEVVQ